MICIESVRRVEHILSWLTQGTPSTLCWVQAWIPQTLPIRILAPIVVVILMPWSAWCLSLWRFSVSLGLARQCISHCTHQLYLVLGNLRRLFGWLAPSLRFLWWYALILIWTILIDTHRALSWTCPFIGRSGITWRTLNSLKWSVVPCQIFSLFQKSLFFAILSF